MSSGKFPDKLNKPVRPQTSESEPLVIAYFRLVNLDPAGPADSRAPTHRRPPLLEICLIPASKAISCPQEGILKVPAGSTTLQLQVGDLFPDVRGLGKPQWAAEEFARESFKDVGYSPAEARSVKQIGPPTDDFITEIKKADT
jgi:hypothetical protein